MRYMMRERLLSWGDDFRIKNADGADVVILTSAVVIDLVSHPDKKD